MPIIDRTLVGELNDAQEASQRPRMRVIDYVETTIVNNIQEYGDSTWLTDISTNRSMNYSQLLSSIKSLAGSLWDRGLRPGDMVLIMAANFIEVPIAFLSVWKAGGRVACLTLNLLKGTIEQRVRQLRPKFIITDELRLCRVAEAVLNLDCVQEIFVIGKADGYTAVSDLLLNEKTEFPVINIDMESENDSLVWLMYSSGTTGIPKGIVHTHRSIIGIIETFMPTQNMNGSKFMYINYMINAGGMIIALSRSLLHANVFCLSDSNDFNLLTAIDRYKPSSVSLFPNQLAWICRHPDLNKYDLSSIVSLFTVGSTINPIYERQIFEKLPNLFLLDILYGSSETGIICSNFPKPDELIGLDRTKAIARHVIGSCGKVLHHCKLKILDKETGETLGPGEVGEVCVNTPFRLKEYLDMPEETALLIRDGWCYIGDKGYYDNNENVFIIGRYKELLKYRMMHVVPTSIEEQMMTHPAVEDVGVVGLPHDIDGELPLAFVVKRTGMTITPQELIDFTNERVVDEEKLRGGVRFIDKIPRNELGKIVRPELVKLL